MGVSLFLFKLGFRRELERGYRLSLKVKLGDGARDGLIIVRCFILDGVARGT